MNGLECIFVCGLVILSSQLVTKAYQYPRVASWRGPSLHREHVDKVACVSSTRYRYRASTGFLSRLHDSSADRTSDSQSRGRSMPRVGDVVIAQVDAFSEDGTQDSAADSTVLLSVHDSLQYCNLYAAFFSTLLALHGWCRSFWWMANQ